MGHNVVSNYPPLCYFLFAKHLSPIYCYDCFESYRQEGRIQFVDFCLNLFSTQQPFLTTYLLFENHIKVSSNIASEASYVYKTKNIANKGGLIIRTNAIIRWMKKI